MTGILVIAYNRPKYLHVCLDSIFRISDLESPVFCFVDGGGDKNAEVVQTASEFPALIRLRQKNLGTLWHLTLSLKEVFSISNIDELIYIEEDLLVKPNILEYVSRAPRDGFFLNLCSHNSCLASEYRSLGNLITKKNFNQLFQYVHNKKFVGKLRPKYPSQVLDNKTRGHDPVYYRFILDTGNKTRFSKTPYVAHFGIRGKNFRRLDDKSIKLEDYMFSGDKDKWLTNVIHVLETENHKALMPNEFRYA